MAQQCILFSLPMKADRSSILASTHCTRWPDSAEQSRFQRTPNYNHPRRPRPTWSLRLNHFRRASSSLVLGVHCAAQTIIPVRDTAEHLTPRRCTDDHSCSGHRRTPDTATLHEALHLVVDGTFKTASNLVIQMVHGLLNSGWHFPLVHGLLPGKTQHL
jgi:hypothetical protein